MTGEEFEKQIRSIGLKKSDVAKRLGIDPDTVTARCRDAVVPKLYMYALIGLSIEAISEPLRVLATLAETGTISE